MASTDKAVNELLTQSGFTLYTYNKIQLSVIFWTLNIPLRFKYALLKLLQIWWYFPSPPSSTYPNSNSHLTIISSQSMSSRQVVSYSLTIEFIDGRGGAGLVLVKHFFFDNTPQSWEHSKYAMPLELPLFFFLWLVLIQYHQWIWQCHRCLILDFNIVFVILVFSINTPFLRAVVKYIICFWNLHSYHMFAFQDLSQFILSPYHSSATL